MGGWLMYFHWHWPETSTETHVNRYLYMGAMSNSERIILENWGSHWGSRPCGDFFYHLLRVVPRRGNIILKKCIIDLFNSFIYSFIYFFILFIYLFNYLFYFLFVYLFMYIWRLPFMYWLTWVCFKIQGFNIRYHTCKKRFLNSSRSPLGGGRCFF